jgi:tetratricopeptide (TPR) repeat protein
MPREDPERIRLLPILAETLQEATAFTRADEVLGEARELAEETGDEAAAVHADLVDLLQSLATDPSYRFESGLSRARQARDRAEAMGDPELLWLAEEWLVAFLFWSGRSGEAVSEVDRAVDQARRRGLAEAQISRVYRSLAGPLVWGVVPVEDGIRRATEILEWTTGAVEADVRNALGGLLAMRGDFEAAEEELIRAGSAMEELGMSLNIAVAQVPALVDFLKGDAEAAETRLRLGIEELRAAGETGFLSTSAALLGEALYRQGKYEEAEDWTTVSEESAAEDDVASQSQWRSVRGLTLARLGRVEEAEQLAREAVEVVVATDHLTMQADSWFALAEVLWLAGKRDEARAAAERASEAWERKGIVVEVERARRLIEEIGE